LVHGASYSWFVFARGLAEFREGKFDQAIATMRGDATLLGGHIVRPVIAMALHRTGRLTEARKTLALAIPSHDSKATQAREQFDWTCHLLRREAEGVVLPNLPAFLRGEYQPRENDERFALLAGQLANCEFEGRMGTAARLYADALATEPELAEDVAAGIRYHAARVAALAGCCQGKDADQLRDDERTLRRRQALDWLRQDLTWSAKLFEGRKAQTNDWIVTRLRFWLVDPDLAGVHTKDALARLLKEDRAQWERLWSDVDVLLKRVRE
jgi:serine/threonine-protein kinase